MKLIKVEKYCGTTEPRGYHITGFEPDGTIEINPQYITSIEPNDDVKGFYMVDMIGNDYYIYVDEKGYKTIKKHMR